MTVTEYFAALPPDRAAELKRVRAAIRGALPKGYEEAVRGSLIAYQVPLASGMPVQKWVEIARSARQRPKPRSPKPA